MFASVEDYIKRIKEIGHEPNDAMIAMIARRIERDSAPCDCYWCVARQLLVHKHKHKQKDKQNGYNKNNC